MTEHSPLPWHNDGFAIRGADGESPILIFGKTGKPLANRRLIIAAVNTRVDYAPLEIKYADLLVAAKMAVKDYQERFEEPQDFAGFNILLDAIAKAEQT